MEKGQYIPRQRGICVMPDCGRPEKCDHLCSTHYIRRMKGKPLDAPIRTFRQTGECRVEGCERKPLAKNLCAPHYQRQKDGRPLDAPFRSRTRADCAVDGCERLSSAYGMCPVHYQRQRRSGSTDLPTRAFGKDDLCMMAGCGRLRGDKGARGYCSKHYRLLKSRGVFADGRTCASPAGCREPAADGDRCFKHVSERRPRCSLDGCERPARGSGVRVPEHRFCDMHFHRLRRYGNAGPIGSVVAPKGTGSIDKNGYRIVQIGDRRGPEHRFIYEKIIGRPLRGWENVHHKNGIRHDNRPNNLELWVKPQPPGQRPIDLAEWVVEHYREVVVSVLGERQ